MPAAENRMEQYTIWRNFDTIPILLGKLGYTALWASQEVKKIEFLSKSQVKVKQQSQFGQ